MKAIIENTLKEALGSEYVPGTVAVQGKEEFGHYTTPIAMRLAKEAEMPPRVVAENVKERLESAAPAGLFERVEVAGSGFVNIWVADDAVRAEFTRVFQNSDFGSGDTLKGKRVMVEYTDPNPFKQFHIGHLMTNIIGESLARVHEAAGAEVLRVNYQGDVGLHVADSVWGMMQMKDEMPAEGATLAAKTEFLGRAYARGANAYKEDPAAKAEIEAINKKIYERSDKAVNELYDRGREWSLDYFETLYERLGTKFVHYYFESEMGPEGLKVVQAHPEVFVESEGAVIFPGEKYGLHTRVFVNKLGLPTYEAKELGLNKRKFEMYQPDLSFIATANEINEYFRVLLKAMELVVPEAGAVTRHIGHGMLRLPSGKMSSRTGDVITAEQLIEEVKHAVSQKMEGREGMPDEEKENIKEKVALAAIRHSILRQGIGKDIVFDMNTSVALHGDSGPYLQYTYARLRRLLTKSEAAGPSGVADAAGAADLVELKSEDELRLMRKMFQFPDQVQKSVEELTMNNLTEYLFEFSNLANRFYEGEQILEDGNVGRRSARLLLAAAASRVIARGLNMLGIEVLESI